MTYTANPAIQTQNKSTLTTRDSGVTSLNCLYNKTAAFGTVTNCAIIAKSMVNTRPIKGDRLGRSWSAKSCMSQKTSKLASVTNDGTDKRIMDLTSFDPASRRASASGSDSSPKDLRLDVDSIGVLWAPPSLFQ